MKLRTSYFICIGFVALNLAFSSCGQKGMSANQTPVVGELDSAFIAQDTLLQIGLETSYEYHKTLMVNKNLVYDIVGWGESYNAGEMAIIKRGADNKPDTVFSGKRTGGFENSFVTNLNEQSEITEPRQICVIVRPRVNSAFSSVVGYSLPDIRPLQWKDEFIGRFDTVSYPGRDSFFVLDNTLMRVIPVYEQNDQMCCPTGGRWQLSYRLRKDKIEIAKRELLK